MSKNESLKLKGVAIIMMFWHHLFGCGEFLTLPENTWFNFLGSLNNYIGWGLKLCISVFAFISGYALYISYFKNKGSIFKRLAKFLITYWTMLFLVGVPYMYLTGRLTFQNLFISLFALLHDDSALILSFSWYVKLYVLVLLFSPLIKRISDKIDNVVWEAIVFIAIPLNIYWLLPDTEAVYTGVFAFTLSTLRLLLQYYPIFHIGIMFGKYRLFDKLFKKMEHFSNKSTILVSIILIILSIVCRTYYLFNSCTDLLCGVTLSLSVLAIFKSIKIPYIEKILKFLGKYSFQYWLLSGMFFLNTSELQWILYIPKESFLILIWSFALLTPFAFLMSKISNKIITKIVK